MNLSLTFAVLLGLLACAVWFDQRARRIPNALIASGLTVSMMLSGYVGGWQGLGLALAGLLVGLVVMLPFYVLRYLGAGDVKLVAMVGAFVGPLQVGSAILYTMLAGGFLALVAIGIRRLTSGNEVAEFSPSEPVGLEGSGQKVLATRSAIKLPYAWAVMCGTVLSQMVPLR